MDDGRRFRELWKELVYARCLASILAVVPVWFGYSGLTTLCLHIMTTRELVGLRAEGVVFMSVGVALPIHFVRKGWRVYLVAVASAMAALLFSMGVCYLLPETEEGGLAVPLLTMATVGAALGTVEGLSERSVATLWAGLLGGAAAGTLSVGVHLGFFVPYEAFAEEGPMWVLIIILVLNMWASVVTLQLGIGLSLALGRYIRDLPKRPAARPDGDAAPPDA